MNLRLCLLLCGLCAFPSLAEGSAKEHFDRGMISFNLQDWPNALRELKAAYAADQQPNFLFTIAQAQRLSGDCEAAILTYRSFLRTASPSGRAAAEGLIHQCENTVEKNRLATLEREQEEQRRKEQQRAKETRTQQPEQRGETAQRAPVAPPETTVVQAPAPLNTVWYADPFGDGLAIAGLATTGAGVALLVVGNTGVTHAANASDFPTYQKQVVAAQTLQRSGAVALSAGGALIVGAVVRYLVVGARAPSAPTVAVLVNEQGAVFSVNGRF